jgi:putative ABC transport system permease protein
MLNYYLGLAWLGLRRNPVLTALMVLAIAIGIGASITTLTVLRALSGDPLPGRSAAVFYAQLEPREQADYVPGGEPPGQMTYVDAMNLLRDAPAERQAVMAAGAAALQPTRSDQTPFLVDLRFTSASFFSMFGVPFLYGKGWSAADDSEHARVAVISRELNDKLFGGDNSVGKMLRMDNKEVTIIGVLDRWRPSPHFYDLSTGDYTESEDAFVPVDTAIDLRLGLNGGMECWGEPPAGARQRSPTCLWLQFWVELPNAAKARAYEEYLRRYSAQQHELGRFQRPTNVRLRSLMQWLDYQQVVPSDVRLQAWLAFGFLIVCLTNTMGLMLAKFLRRAAEIGVRRALGATRKAVFAQLLVEAGGVGACGALFGLALAAAGLYAIRLQPLEYVSLVRMDGPMLLAAVLLALLSSVLAGIFPAWRACRIAPALQLKSK